MDSAPANPSPIHLGPGQDEQPKCTSLASQGCDGRRWSEGPDEGPHPLRFAQHARTDMGEGSLLRFITCGSVDDGKSTLIGRLIHDTGAVPEDQLATLHKDSKKFGTQGERLDFALLVDGLSAEREQGITIDVAYRYFHTQKRAFIVADTPGHEQYTRNMATGASTADLAIILIDARKGVLPQTRRHSFITSMLGVKQAVIAINKMDLVGYSQEVFERIVADYREMAKTLSFEALTFLPLSALEGDNIAVSSSTMPWYKGRTLLQHLEEAPSFHVKEQAPFRLPVQWVNRPSQDFRGFSGTVASGHVKPGDAVIARPSGQKALVARIVTFDGDREVAGPQEAITLVLDREIDVSRGESLVSVDDTLLPRQKAGAHLFWMSEKAMLEGGRFLMKLGTSETDIRIAELHHALDIHSFDKVQKRVLAMNEIGHVDLAFDKPLLAAPYKQDRTFGAFILIDKLTNETVALGLIDQKEARTGATPDTLIEKTHWSEILFGITETPWQHALAKAVTWRMASAIFIAAATFFLTRNLFAALFLGGLDATLRPLLRRLHGALWSRAHMRLTARDLRDAQDEGSGI
jgi:bifunctional enzyme CysN/CysC